MLRTCYHVTASGKTFAMISEPRTHAEALAFARVIWPGCVVE